MIISLDKMEPLVIRVFEDLGRSAVLDVHTTCQKLWSAGGMSEVIPTKRIVQTLLRDLPPLQRNSCRDIDRVIYLKAILNVGRGKPESFLIRTRMNVYESFEDKCIILNYHLVEQADADPFYERQFPGMHTEWRTRRGVQFALTMWTYETLQTLGIGETPPIILAREHAKRLADSYDEPVELSLSWGFPKWVLLEFLDDPFGFNCGIAAKSEDIGVMECRGTSLVFSDDLTEVCKKISLHRHADG